MKTKMFSVIAFLLIAVLATSVSALNVRIDEVQINNFEIQPNSANDLAVNRDGELEIDVKVTFLEATQHASVEAEINGVDHYTLEDESRSRDFAENDSTIFNLKIDLPDDVDEDDYTLLLKVQDRDASFTQDYKLRVRNPQTSLKVKDIRLFPRTVEAGSYLLSTVRVENLGEADEDDVKVTLSVPELGLSTSSFINEVDVDEEEDSEEMLLFIPECSRSGDYEVQVDVLYDDRHESTSASEIVKVLKGTCSADDNTANDATGAIVVTHPEQPDNGSLRDGLEIALLVLLVVLVIIALIIGFSKMHQE
jgi:hypothetical protein